MKKYEARDFLKQLFFIEYVFSMRWSENYEHCLQEAGAAGSNPATPTN